MVTMIIENTDSPISRLNSSLSIASPISTEMPNATAMPSAGCMPRDWIAHQSRKAPSTIISPIAMLKTLLAR